MPGSTVAGFRSGRWTAYVVDEDGWIYPRGDRRADYVVEGNDALAARLAHVPGSARIEVHVRALLDFYQDFGLLGQTVLAGTPRAIEREGRRILAHGDQLAWALAHAENVRWILALLGARGKTLARRLRAAQAQATELRTIHVPTVTPPEWWTPLALDVGELVRTSTDVVAARHLIAARLNSNLADVARSFDPIGGEERFQFRALTQVIYWQLADQMGTRPRRCWCGTYFFPRDARQRFCPAPPGAGESRCAVRHRVERFRRRRRSGTPR